MKNKQPKVKKQALNEVFGSSAEEAPENQPAKRGIYTKPMILKNLTESFDNFRQGMDKLANVYTLIASLDPELHRKVSRFGENMTKMLEGYAKLIENEGGQIDGVTKPEGLQKYFGNQGMSELGMNENKEEIFNARVDLQIGRIKSIMENTKRQ